MGHVARVLRAVFFDLDDTLLPEASAIAGAFAATCGPVEERLELPQGAFAEAVQAVAQARYASFDSRGFDALFGVSWEECLWGRFGAPSQRQLPGLGGIAETLRRTVWSDSLAALGRPALVSPEDLEARYVAERRIRLRPFPEAEPVLSSLGDRALALACITNGASEVQREKLLACGLGHFFDEILISGEEGTGKPDPALLLRACERLGVRPDEVVYVGNSRYRDVKAAAAAGIRSVLLDRPETREPPSVAEPDRIVYELSGLLGWVDGWRTGRAFRVMDPSRAPVAVDEPWIVDDRHFTRMGREEDLLRPAVRGPSRLGVLESALRSLRARAGMEPWRHDLGEEVDWDALLR